MLLFVVIERGSMHPMLPVGLFANAVFSWISFSVLLSSATFFGMLFVLNLYFLTGAGYTPLQTGAAMLPLALCATCGNLVSAKLSQKISPMRLMIGGAVVRLVAFLATAAVIGSSTYSLIALPLLLIGFGAGLSNPMAIAVLLSAADRKYSGITSGISTATGQLGASIGVAVFGAFLADPQRVAEGTRIAAAISIASTILIILIIGSLERYRQRTVVK
jgi:DHA2 family methylenomycin A resistance protein-like MFS transporter